MGEEGERGEAVASVGAASASLALVGLWSRLACWVGRLACLGDAAFKKNNDKRIKTNKNTFLYRHIIYQNSQNKFS